MKDIVKVIFLLIFLITFIGIQLHQEQEYKRILEKLTSMNLKEIKEFRIYPRVSFAPSKTYRTFDAFDPLIKDFFLSLSDMHSYSPSHDRVVSLDHSWFVELATTQDIRFQIGCYIPSQQGELVIGELATGYSKNPQFYGKIQSRQLYQWYQTYSHRWLTPEASPPAPKS